MMSSHFGGEPPKNTKETPDQLVRKTAQMGFGGADIVEEKKKEASQRAANSDANAEKLPSPTFGG